MNKRHFKDPLTSTCQGSSERRVFEFFKVNTELAERAVLASTDLTTVKTKLPPVGLDLMQEIIICLGVQCLTN